jgi:CRISPR system Cascade subunit CasB
MYRYVANWVGAGDRRWNEECLYLIAALFASYPEAGSTEGNFGESARLLRLAKESDSIERRFVALLAADTRALPNHVRYMVSLLRAENIPVNWLKLLRDLHRWKNSSRTIERAWARRFWQLVPKPESDAETPKEHQMV